MSTLLRAPRVRELLGLLGTCGEVSMDQRRRLLIDGIQHLFGARAALTVCASDYTVHGQFRVEGVVSSGFEGIHGERFLASVAAGTSEDPVVTIGAGLRSGAYRRRDVLSDRAWYRTRWASEEFRAMGLDDGLYARVALDARRTECLGVFRPPGARTFTTEDRALMGLLTPEVPRLVRARSRPMFIAVELGLSRREAQTLERLCRGESEKQVAEALAISRHTVHTYVKALYRRFDVTSRSELLARFIGGSS